MTGTIVPPPPPPPPIDEPHAPTREAESRLPSSRRRWWIFVVATLVLVGGGVATYAAISTTEDEPRSGEVEQGSSDQVVREKITAATEAAAAARTGRHMSTTTIDGVEVMTMDTAFDEDAGLYALTMDVDSSLFDGDDPVQMEMILDQQAGTWYMGAETLDYPTDADWVSIDVAALVAPLGISPDELQSDASAPLLNIAPLLDSANDVVDLGVEELDNVEVRHVQIILSTDEFLAANPDVLATVETEGLEDQMPEEIPYDLWITESNQLHRTAFGFEVADMEMLTETDFMSVGDPVDIKIPAPQDVVDMADLEREGPTGQTDSDESTGDGTISDDFVAVVCGDLPPAETSHKVRAGPEPAQTLECLSPDWEHSATIAVYASDVRADEGLTAIAEKWSNLAGRDLTFEELPFVCVDHIIVITDANEYRDQLIVGLNAAGIPATTC